MKNLFPKQTILRPLVLLLIAACAFGTVLAQKKAAAQIAAACTSLRETVYTNDFSNVSIQTTGKALYIYDFTNKQELFAKNARTSLPLASLTKLMSLRVALKGRNLSDTYTLTAADENDQDTTQLSRGQTFSLKNLTALALIPSSNDAGLSLAHSRGISDSAFFAAMNTESIALGLRSFHYESVTGLDTIDLEPTSLGSARDVTMLIQKDLSDFPEAIKQSTASEATVYSEQGAAILVKNTNQYSKALSVLQASKTGYTDSAGGNLAIVWQDLGSGHQLGATVLGAGEDTRFADMIVLHQAAGRYLADTKNILSSCESKPL